MSNAALVAQPPPPQPTGSPPAAPVPDKAAGPVTACPSPAAPLLTVDLDAPLPRDLPVFGDVLHLDGLYMGNYFWWVTHGAGSIALLRDWLAALPEAVIHFDANAALAWRPFHNKVRASDLCRMLAGARGADSNSSLSPADPRPPRYRPAARHLWARARSTRPRPRRAGAVAQPPRAGASLGEEGAGGCCSLARSRLFPAAPCVA